MKVETFLHFWNTHDTVIIQSLVACILLTAVFYVVGRVFSGDAKSEPAIRATSKNVSSLSPAMTTEIEKTLQKILENQSSNSGAAASNGAALAGSVSSASAANSGDIQKLQTELQAREQKLKILEQQLAEIKNNPPSPAGGSGDQKLKELDLGQCGLLAPSIYCLLR